MKYLKYSKIKKKFLSNIMKTCSKNTFEIYTLKTAEKYGGKS